MPHGGRATARWGCLQFVVGMLVAVAGMYFLAERSALTRSVSRT